MPRQARLDAPGTLHHVIIRGIEKRNIVTDSNDYQNFISRMGRLAIDLKVQIYAWALMPNHIHILLRSGPQGLPKFMRRLLTGYAITYNQRHHRHGHLFQNRYKSIVCDEDTYFTELVRYIHLNPLRAGLVTGLGELEKYPWCGHGVLMGQHKQDWQDSDGVLSWFGKVAGIARKAYRNFVQEGISQGKRPELVGGGLIRSQGGWSQVVSMQKRGRRELADERILGSGEFVERMIEEAENKYRTSFRHAPNSNVLEQLIRRTCCQEGISTQELKAGSRRHYISKVRSDLAKKMIEEHGVSLAETARQLGVSTPAISKILRK